MRPLTGYTLVECLHEGPASVIYRARDDRDGAPVVLKMRNPEGAHAFGLGKLRHEHMVLKGLDVPGVIKLRAFLDQEDGMALVFDDFGGEPLASRLQQRKLDLVTFLSIAVQIAEILGQIHAQHIIHKDINPKNILIEGAARSGHRLQHFDPDVARGAERQEP